MTTNEKENWIRKEIGFIPVESPDGIDFYYRAMHDYEFGLCDADDYAWLNTLFGYDIGIENAAKIITWFYMERDTTVQEVVGAKEKDTLRNICELEIGIMLDFSKFATEEPKCLQIFLRG